VTAVEKVVFRCCGVWAWSDAAGPPQHRSWCRVGPRMQPLDASEELPRYPTATEAWDGGLPTWAKPGELVPCRCGQPLSVDVTCRRYDAFRARVLVCQVCMHGLTQAHAKLRRKRAGVRPFMSSRPRVFAWFSPKHELSGEAALMLHLGEISKRIKLTQERTWTELLSRAENSQVRVLAGDRASDMADAIGYCVEALKKDEPLVLVLPDVRFTPLSRRSLMRDVTP
jgi:hypothetical protein